MVCKRNCQCCEVFLCLHNMMVASRMAQGEEESEEFYAFPGLARGDGREGGLVVDRSVAEVQLHAQLYGANNQQDHSMTDQESQVLDSLRFQYAQRRWEFLYDLHKHLRLRNSIMNHIEA